ncbi:unnamed protein product [Cylindrotheca closterium]|uniref:Uncharacterized protein n=1 Tax=Cylindrotheca closterium TaxID=2856 RepID=A0AAD2CGJ6_9STRA|nr:unnamed protein product [Cylindrotheca closterium]
MRLLPAKWGTVQSQRQVWFRDCNGSDVADYELQNVDLSGGVLVLRKWTQNDFNNANFLSLSTLLSQSAAKLQTVKVEGVSQSSPEYLAFLIAACTKAHEVQLKSCTLSDTVCTCLMSSMMNSYGIKELTISFRTRMASANQARLLFQGVALSTSIQKLDLFFDFEDMEDSGIALVQAFETNQSLTSFSLYSRSLNSDFILESIIRAAVNNVTLETLTINAPHSIRHGTRRLSLSALHECLCRDDCSVQELTLESILLDGDMGDNSILQNSSLKAMKLRGRANVTCSQVVKFAKSFTCLENLDIDFEPYSDLTSLGELLLGEGSTLQSLKLFVQPKAGMDENWQEFFQKLPKMKSLRNLDLPREVVRSEACRSALLNAMWLNSSIENMNLLKNLGRVSPWSDAEDETFAEFFCQISHLFSVNRGGRRYLQNKPSEQPLPQNLWPLVLQRAMGIDYISDYHKSKYPKLQSLEFDAIYWLLREKLFT